MGADAVKKDFAASGKIHRTSEVEKSGFAASAAANDGHEFTRGDFERNIVEGADKLAVGRIVLRDFAERNHYTQAKALRLTRKSPTRKLVPSTILIGSRVRFQRL